MRPPDRCRPSRRRSGILRPRLQLGCRCHRTSHWDRDMIQMSSRSRTEGDAARYGNAWGLSWGALHSVNCSFLIVFAFTCLTDGRRVARTDGSCLARGVSDPCGMHQCREERRRFSGNTIEMDWKARGHRKEVTSGIPRFLRQIGRMRLH